MKGIQELLTFFDNQKELESVVMNMNRSISPKAYKLLVAHILNTCYNLRKFNCVDTTTLLDLTTEELLPSVPKMSNIEAVSYTHLTLPTIYSV